MRLSVWLACLIALGLASNVRAEDRAPSDLTTRSFDSAELRALSPDAEFWRQVPIGIAPRAWRVYVENEQVRQRIQALGTNFTSGHADPRFNKIVAGTATPLFVTKEEAGENGDAWKDWVRIHSGALVVPKNGVEPFVMLHVLTKRGETPPVALVANGEGLVDFTQAFQQVPLTREIRVQHWDLVRSVTKDFWARTNLVLGLSTSDLKVGSTSTGGATDRSKTAYFAGLGLSVNPYVTVTAGATIQGVDSSLRAHPAVGITLDLGIIGALFKK